MGFKNGVTVLRSKTVKKLNSRRNDTIDCGKLKPT